MCRTASSSLLLTLRGGTCSFLTTTTRRLFLVSAMLLFTMFPHTQIEDYFTLSTDKHVKEQEQEESPTTLVLLGERHSGTKWMTAHLEECFGLKVQVVNHLSRWKHWFQENDNYQSRNLVVVAQFRHVHQWVEAMRENPYHSPAHFGLSWQDFVTKAWTMPRYGIDAEKFDATNRSKTTNTTKEWSQPICPERFRPYEVIPCLSDRVVQAPGFRKVHALYELRHGDDDTSGQPYDNILQLRADKIRNFLEIASFEGVRHLEVVRYEDMVRNGTGTLIRTLESQLNVKASCQPSEPHEVTKRQLPQEYVNWMGKHVDWKMESLVGYFPEQ